ncbi:MAG: YbaB/EbfC family nucleoid-associated protein [Bacteroidia bacterium]|nr:YbaB/EbfC family nucleoid-associated protein [Bacteroidia bacterium]MDW8334443.1 YbaB/EbfC family nucleoid-associated protein [Bacteroidia bacterium]
MNLGDLFGKVRELQETFIEAKERMNEMYESADAGGGMVVVTANLNKQIIEIKLDPEVLKDKEMAEDLLVSAVNKALEKADARGREELAKAASGILPPTMGSLGPLDWGKLGL